MLRVILTLSVLSLALLTSGALNAAGVRYGSKLCKTEGYTCYTVKSRDTWQKIFPDEDARMTAMKVNRIGNRLSRGMVIAIPDSFGASFMDHAPFPQEGEATGSKRIIISISKLAFGAYDGNGQLQYWGPVSTAKGYCPDLHHGCHTPTGSFAIYNKGGAGCVSKKFPVGRGGAPMPYCMFFNGGFAMHGSNDVPGYNASHGCVRMFTSDAKWLNHEFTSGEHKVSVVVEP
jgi:L,D-transpeptidase ErfK/SrfK